MPAKPTATYFRHDPLKKGVTHVAINTGTTPHMVFAAFRGVHQIPPLASGFVVHPIAEARELYEFVKEKPKTQP